MTEELKATTVKRDELVEEIFERKQTEERLQHEKLFSDTVINSLPGVFYLFDDKGKYLRWNSNLEKITGYSDEEISKMSPLDFFTGEDKKRVEERIQEVFTKGESSVEADLVTKKGDRIPYFFTGKIITVGNKSCLAGVGIDISSRVKAEEALLLNKKDWEDTFNTITDMVTVHDRDYNIIRANKAAEKLLKLPSLDNILNVKCFKYYHGTGEPPKGCPSCNCYKTGEPATFEIFEPNLNMFIEIRAIARFDKNNQIIGLIHVVRDITKRRNIEYAVQKAKNEWETTFDNASEFIALVDKTGGIIRCNKSFAEFVRIPIKEITGLMCTDFIPVNPEQFKPGMPATKVEVMTTNHEWLYISCCPILDENGQFMRTVIVGTDITSLKYTEERLKKSEVELKGRIDELERFYEMAVGREIRMKDLKKEIKKLEKELSKYKVTQT